MKIVKELKFLQSTEWFSKNAVFRYEKSADIKEDTSLWFFYKQPVYKQLALGIIFSKQKYKIQDSPNMFSDFLAFAINPIKCLNVYADS